MKVLMLNGGGLESLALAMILKDSGHEVTSLHIECEYPNAAKMKLAAQAIAAEYCTNHVEMGLSGLSPMGWNETLQRFQPIQYQQLVFSSIAASYAQMNDIQHIVSGFRHKFMTAQFKTIFTSLLNEVTLVGLSRLELIHPLQAITTDEELYDIIKDSPLLASTISCLSDPECGVCFKCKLRKTYNI